MESQQSTLALPYTTPFAVITPRVTGGISTVSSFLIIYLILRSDKRLGTIYHRIMFCMSCADILCSLSMSLTTLPMPKTIPPEAEFWEKPYEDWSGSKYGNTQTCTAQGFLFTFGIVTMYWYNALLCMYYACAIALKMREASIRKYVEPYFHISAFLIGLGMAVPPLVLHLYNPTSWEVWCVPSPLSCDGNRDCVRGKYSGYRNNEIILTVLICSLFFIIITSLSMVVYRVIDTNRKMQLVMEVQKKMYREDNDAGNERIQTIMTRAERNHDITRTVLTQAFIYFLAFLLTLIFPIIQICELHAKGAVWPHYLELVFTPLQGFFNFAIFLHFKVKSFQRGHPEVSYSAVLRKIFTGNANDVVIISRISLLQFDEEARRLEVQIYSEYDEELLSYDLSKVPSGTNMGIEFMLERKDEYNIQPPQSLCLSACKSKDICDCKESLSGLDNVKLSSIQSHDDHDNTGLISGSSQISVQGAWSNTGLSCGSMPSTSIGKTSTAPEVKEPKMPTPRSFYQNVQWDHKVTKNDSTPTSKKKELCELDEVQLDDDLESGSLHSPSHVASHTGLSSSILSSVGSMRGSSFSSQEQGGDISETPPYSS